MMKFLKKTALVGAALLGLATFGGAAHAYDIPGVSGGYTNAQMQQLLHMFNSGVNPGTVAAGTNLATATTLKQGYTELTTVASGTGVKLPALVDGVFPIGRPFIVYNRGANAVLIYPPSGSTAIDALSAGAGLSVAASGSISVVCLTAIQCYSR